MKKNLILGLAVCCLALCAGAQELVAPSVSVSPQASQLRARMVNDRNLKEVRIIGLDLAALSRPTLTFTIDGTAATFYGKATRSGWSGAGAGDARLTEQLTLERVPMGATGILTMRGRTFQIYPLGGGAHALAELAGAQQ